MIEEIKLNLKPIGMIILGLSIVGGVAIADTAWAYESYTPMDLFPDTLGNKKTYKRLIENGNDKIFDEVEVSNDRKEPVNGVDSTVLGVRAGGTLIEETSIAANVNGLFVTRWKRFDTQFKGFQVDLTYNFTPAIKLTDGTPEKDEVVTSGGTMTLSSNFGVEGTASYTASSKVTEFGSRQDTNAGVFMGVRTFTTFGLAGSPPLSGTGTGEIFWGWMVGPVTMKFDGVGLPSERKWLKSANFLREDTNIFSANAPIVRATQVGRTVTGFRVIQNAGDVPATWCGFSPLLGKLSMDVNFAYAETNPMTNEVIGPLNPLVNIDPGAIRTFVFALQPMGAFPFKPIRFVDDCWETAPALKFSGVNTFGLSASMEPTPDIPLVASKTLVQLPGVGQWGVNSYAGFNLGITADIAVSAKLLDPSTPVDTYLCELNLGPPVSCMQPLTMDPLQVNWANNTPRFFASFSKATATFGDDFANNRFEIKAEYKLQGDQVNQVGGFSVGLQLQL